MKAKEEYSIRLEMSQMHEEFIERMSEAYDAGYYVEAVWHYEEMVGRETAASLRCSYFTAHVYTAIYFQK